MSNLTVVWNLARSQIRRLFDTVTASGPQVTGQLKKRTDRERETRKKRSEGRIRLLRYCSSKERSGCIRSLGPEPELRCGGIAHVELNCDMQEGDEFVTSLKR